MEQRKLGSQGLVVSALGLGCMGMTGAYGVRDDAESIATIHRAVDLGVDFFDTADVYGPFINEQLLGNALKGLRQRVKIATKFGNTRTPDGKRTINGRPEYVKAACDASLKRLGIDHIDLYYQHRVDRTVPIEETVGAMAELVKQGKVRYLGLSEAAAGTIRRAHATHPISAVQSEYSLWSRDLEEDVIPALRELGIGLVPYAALGRGFLSGEITSTADFPPGDSRLNHPRFSGENFQKNLELVERVKQIAARQHARPGQLALAWVLAQGDFIVPIPGTKHRKYLEENVAALQVKLTPAELAEIEQATPKGSAAGDRNREMSLIYG